MIGIWSEIAIGCNAKSLERKIVLRLSDEKSFLCTKLLCNYGFHKCSHVFTLQTSRSKIQWNRPVDIFIAVLGLGRQCHISVIYHLAE